MSNGFDQQEIQELVKETNLSFYALFAMLTLLLYDTGRLWFISCYTRLMSISTIIWQRGTHVKIYNLLLYWMGTSWSTSGCVVIVKKTSCDMLTWTQGKPTAFVSLLFFTVSGAISISHAAWTVIYYTKNRYGTILFVTAEIIGMCNKQPFIVQILNREKWLLIMRARLCRLTSCINISTRILLSQQLWAQRSMRKWY